MAELVRIRRAGEARPGFDGLLIPWNVPADVVDGRHRYREAWAPGSVTATGRVPVFDGHDPVTLQRGPLIGALEAVESLDDGLHGRIELARTGRAAEVRDLAELVDVGLSVEVLTDDGSAATTDDVVLRSAGRLVGLAVLMPPVTAAYPGAAVTALRSSEATTTSEEAMPENEAIAVIDRPPPAPPLEPPLELPAPSGSSAVLLDALEPVMRAAVEAEVARAQLAGPSTPGHPAHPLARFRSLGEYVHHVLHEGRDDEVVFRALADQITPANPGVVPPGWVREVFGIIDRSWPLLELLRRPAPPNGMDVSWPYFAGDFAALVAAQAAEKTAIHSVVVALLKGTAPLETYAGGSDVSYQLLTRSDPSYLDAYMRIMAIGYGWTTGVQLSIALADGATGFEQIDWAAANDDAIRGAVFGASAKVARATGAPASVIAAAEDVFGTLGGALTPAAYGTQNLTGTATASTLAVNVSGLPVVPDYGLPAGTAIATNREAGAWFNDGPFVITAEDVEKLGRNVAIWGLGAPAVITPSGVVLMQAIAPLAADTASSSRSKRDS
jgi:hypothetical protein